MCSPVSDPAKPDSDYDELLDTEDPKPLSTINNGIPIELNKEEIEMLQKWLVNLGYLDMKKNPYGENYGPITHTAVYIYQMNHGFQTTLIRNEKEEEEGLEQIDDLTYSTIANDYANKFGNGESDYYNYTRY